MINWIKAEYAKNIKVKLITGEVFYGDGDGLELADSFEGDEAKDTFFLSRKDGAIGLFVDEIENIDFLT